MQLVDLAGGRVIGGGNPLFVIAEAGVNHNGSLDMALKLVDVAAEAGADAVKFQTFKAEHIITKAAPKAQYHIETTGSDSTQTWYELLKSQELTPDMHRALMKRSKERGIIFMSTPYDIESVDLLDELDVELFKVASTDADNLHLLGHMAGKGRPMILSTAMSTIDEIKTSVAFVRGKGVNKLVVMQCTGDYPAPAADANLRAMDSIARECDVVIGYSDHVMNPAICHAAIGMGAKAYEKHYTLGPWLPGPDHRASLDPVQLKALIADLRDVEAALGDGRKRVMPSEEKNRGRLRKSVLAARALPAGQVLTEADLVVKRAGGEGIPAGHYFDVIGRKLKRAVAEEEAIPEEALA